MPHRLRSLGSEILSPQDPGQGFQKQMVQQREAPPPRQMDLRKDFRTLLELLKQLRKETQTRTRRNLRTAQKKEKVRNHPENKTVNLIHVAAKKQIVKRVTEEVTKTRERTWRETRLGLETESLTLRERVPLKKRKMG